ncbi:MAG: NADP oxidoreductase [Verrucomicrobia bacterium]|nr:NADP oxidoreductase [Verrucomicrobiota bacterium]
MARNIENQSLRVAVIGSGPAGLYTTAQLLKCLSTVQVDIFEKLPSPFGLLRFGVSPDHKHTRHICDLLDPTLADSRVRFFGHVEIAENLTLDQLRPFYHAIVIASGAATDRRLSIPGAELPGCHTSLEFIGWINGHPDFAHRPIPLSAETAVVIGNGNVALDVVRLLLKSPDELADTDIHPPALEALRNSRIRVIKVIGRRGPAQASFRPAELKEVATLADCEIELRQEDFELTPSSLEELSGSNAAATMHQQIVDIFHDIAKTQASARPRRLSFRFLESPVVIEGDKFVEHILLGRNRLTGPPGAQRTAPTGETDRLSCGLIIPCIGHQGTPLAGVPFDPAAGVIPTREGRVMSKGQPVPGLYAAGWIERGATGLIGHNKRDAKRAVNAILADRDLLLAPTQTDVEQFLQRRKITPVGYVRRKGKPSA